MNIEHTERRIRQRSRRRGFTPVRNARIEARIQAMEAVLTLAYSKANSTAMPSAMAIHDEAVRAVARTLPAIPVGVRVNPYW